MHRTTPAGAAAAIAAGLALAAAAPAGAQCTYVALFTDVAQTLPGATTNLRFATVVGTYMAVGARSAAGSNHDLAIDSTSAASPACVGNQLGACALPGGVDVVVGDSRSGHNPGVLRLGQLTRTAGAGAATIELERSARLLVAGAPPESIVTAPPVLDVYQAFLEGGNTYTLNFAHTGADLKVLLFRNPGAGTWWSARGAPAMLATLSASGLFTAPASDDYAMIVVNDDGAAGTYSLWVELCQAPDTLASGVARPAAYPFRSKFNALDPYWHAVGVRGAAGTDWNTTAYDAPNGNPEPVCFGGELAASARTSGVDFVVGDLFNGPLRPYYARELLAAGGGGGLVEWDGGPNEIVVGDTLNPVVRTTGADDVLESWDVLLNPPQQVTIRFAPSGAAALRWFVFENPLQGQGTSAWLRRDQAVLSGTGNAVYAPQSPGWHGFVVVNENGGAGGYTVSIAGAPLVAAGAPPPRTALGTIAPNPLRGHASIGFSLARPAEVRVEIVDVAGRRVARVDAGARPAGAGAVAWDGRAADGSRLPGGVYFARLFAGDAAVGAARLVLLR